MIVLITLLAFAVIAVRGYIPGITAAGSRGQAPSAVSVALVPVLLTVSIVILLAGVIASRQRLPSVMPEPERADERRRWRLGRAGLAVLGALALLGVLVAAGTAIYFIGASRPGEPARPAPPATTTGAAPQQGTVPPAERQPGSAGLTGTALVLTGIAAAGLVTVAMSGLVVVAVSSRRRPVAPQALAVAGTPTAVESLARAAELGLAAMNAPGQDPRTAIIACYVAMERGLAADRAAAPLASDTPMEVLARAFERGALHDAAARELVALFEEARFSPHAMLEGQRRRAERLLRIVLADLPGEVPA
ncbi:DUF4129 domain-containing protein [Nocardia sp. R7R-8]|uniref:DUF4129 domain-containing protein n=1 Tax=Nocardia sp. R7R-8 TaxID=3459304 RepID=UPI00403DC5DB